MQILPRAQQSHCGKKKHNNHFIHTFCEKQSSRNKGSIVSALDAPNEGFQSDVKCLLHRLLLSLTERVTDGTISPMQRCRGKTRCLDLLHRLLEAAEQEPG